jgi:hypothetical protein
MKIKKVSTMKKEVLKDRKVVQKSECGIAKTETGTRRDNPNE